jgi:RimJ/RimL family protein N-acetyltransferase
MLPPRRIRCFRYQREAAGQNGLRLARRPGNPLVLEEKTSIVVGDMTIHSCDRRSGTFAYGITVGKEHRRKGYATEALDLALHYYFQKLRYQKVKLTVCDFNEPSIRLYEKLVLIRPECARSDRRH